MTTTAVAGLRRGARGAAVMAAIAVSTGATGVLIGGAWARVSGDRMAPWIIGRAAGICSYLLLWALVVVGLLLSHPSRARVRRPNTATRIRFHVALAAGTLTFTVLHVVALAGDRYAGVGWWATVLPMHSSYRPVATTLGLIGAWSGLVAGATAGLAGHMPRWLWWPVHKVAAVSLVLVWLHGVLDGADTAVLLGFYLGSGLLVVALALSRYTARTPADLVAELDAELVS